MSYYCKTGLFVGINQYKHLDQKRWLLSAAADATELANCFQTANHRGNWDVLIDSPESQPVRLELVERIYQFVTSINEGDAGILYFSGHGQVVDDSLILAPYDFRAEFAQDSGLALARVLRLMRISSSPLSRFFIVLDCCREGQEAKLGDDIPPNVSIIYACEPGKVTLEDQNSGLLCQYLKKALLRSSKKRGPRHLSVRGVFNKLPAELTGYGPEQAARPELCGNGAHEILLPLADFDTAAPDQSDIVAELVSRDFVPVDTKSRDGVLGLLAHMFGAQGAEHMVSANGKASQLRVKLPQEASVLSSNTVLEQCVEEFNCFYTLDLKWSHIVPAKKFQLIQMQAQMERHSLEGVAKADNTIMLSWKEGHYNGRIVVHFLQDCTVLKITCFAKAGHALPLRFLLPGLIRVYDRFRHLV